MSQIVHIFLKNAPQVIGIFGAIIGAITGALFSNFMSNKGKVNVIVCDDDYKDKQSKSGEYAYYLHLFIHNDSLRPRYIRNIKIKFYNKDKKMVLESSPKTSKFNIIPNNPTFRIHPDDKVTSVIPFYGYEAKDIVLCDIIFGDNSNTLRQAAKIKLSYEYKSAKKDRKCRTVNITIVEEFSLNNVGQAETTHFPKEFTN